jgi:hypothetical protein
VGLNTLAVVLGVLGRQARRLANGVHHQLGVVLGLGQNVIPGLGVVGIHSVTGIGPLDEIDITPLKLAGLTVISAELPNKSSRADRPVRSQSAVELAAAFISQQNQLYDQAVC